MSQIIFESDSEQQTIQVGHDIAMALRVGDLLFLQGNLGVGKSVLARAIIRKLADDFKFEVPSPTYTLCQNYHLELPVAHYDLYRLSDADEMQELGLEDALQTGCALIEWPERVFEGLPSGAIRVEIIHSEDEKRTLHINGDGELLQRIKRSFLIREFLGNHSYGDTKRIHLTGDASARSYEMVITDNKKYLLMNSPALPDGPVLEGGKPYSQIAHLAEDVSAFVAIDKVLLNNGFMAPEILAQDIDAGLLLIEYFGSHGILHDDGNPNEARYMASMEFLAEMHEIDWPTKISLSADRTHQIHAYNEQAILAEVDLLPQWYLPEVMNEALEEEQVNGFVSLWRGYIKQLEEVEKSLVLRDFHSPNILWLGQNSGTNRVGVIDFQDAVIGPCAYDVASLAQDARVDVSEELENVLLNHYVSKRLERNPEFDVSGFKSAYAIMAAQRATKILGIFVRLKNRDDKPGYMKHMPRIRDYLNRSLRHPDLAEMRNWMESVTIL